MRQLLVNRGKVFLEEVPIPTVDAGEVLVRNIVSAVSLGTELSMIRESGLGAIGRVRKNPSLIKQAFGVFLSSGMRKTFETYEAVTKSDIALGYSSCGQVVAVGQGVTDILVGDIVACGGGGKATHSEYVTVTRNLVARVSHDVNPSHACYSAISSIVIHGLRKLGCSFGENIAVIGLGFLGQLASRIAVVSGLNVFAFDIDTNRAELANSCNGIVASSNIEEFKKLVLDETEDYGVDGVIICASSKSSAPVETALEVIRNAGRVVLVGVADIKMDREQLFDSEAEFSVSRSYGPGRYDLFYEEKGIDYPFEYVRWTENRNMKLFLELLAKKQIDISDLVSYEVSLTEAPDALMRMATVGGNHLSLLIRYGDKPNIPNRTGMQIGTKSSIANELCVGFIGAGSFAQRILIPNLVSIPNVRVSAICNKTPLSAKRVGEMVNAELITTDSQSIINSDNIDLVIVSTPHHLHARQVIQCIESHKPVFVEKPLAMNMDELKSIVKKYEDTGGFVTVGFNRRYSEIIEIVKKKLSKLSGPMIVNYEVHTSSLPENHWINDPEIGGGRLVGEGCHFLDLTRFLIQSKWRRINSSVIASRRKPFSSPEDFVVNVDWNNGSISSLIYTTIGSLTLPKERISIHKDGMTFLIDDFRKLTISDNKQKTIQFKYQDKGHKKEMFLIVKSLQTGEMKVQSFMDAAESMKLTLIADEALKLE